MSTAQRLAVGFLCAVLSVLTFHQGMLLLLRELGLFGIPPTAIVWNLQANARAFSLPSLVNLCFWGGLYGAAFGALAPRITWPMWLAGLATGVAAALVGLFIVSALRGTPIAGGWRLMAWVRSLSINGAFGLGLGLIYRWLSERVFPAAPHPAPPHPAPPHPAPPRPAPPRPAPLPRR